MFLCPVGLGLVLVLALMKKLPSLVQYEVRYDAVLVSFIYLHRPYKYGR